MVMGYMDNVIDSRADSLLFFRLLSLVEFGLGEEIKTLAWIG
jgi:hypothetical protein